ncbi:MAG: DUF6599 family protein [Terracidiphilus sp.]
MQSRSARFILTFVLAAGAALFVFAGCKATPRDPFPASGAVNGWNKTDETRVFAANDLWQYIDGDSEQYTAAGVISTATSDYKYNGQIEAVVDVHTMRDAAGAQRIMDNGHSPDAHAVSVGDAGYAYAQSIVFRKGHSLVRIVAYQSTPQTPQALLALAHGVEAGL